MKYFSTKVWYPPKLPGRLWSFSNLGQFHTNSILTFYILFLGTRRELHSSILHFGALQIRVVITEYEYQTNKVEIYHGLRTLFMYVLSLITFFGITYSLR